MTTKKFISGLVRQQLKKISNLVNDPTMVANKKHKNKGIGSKLIIDLINRIKKTKKIKAKMILISTKIPEFYKKFGFKKITSKYDRDYIIMSLNFN